MENNYVLYNGELYHYGVLGMKWGRRLYQRKNGTLTSLGKKRYEREMAKAKSEANVLRNRQATANKMAKLEEMKARNKTKKDVLDGKITPETAKQNAKNSKKTKTKKLSEMTNEEIQAKVDRIKLENELKSLTPEKVSKGKQFAQMMGNDIVKPMIVGAGKDVIKKALDKHLGLGDSDFEKLERKSKIADFKKKIAESEMSQRKNRKEQAADDAAKKTEDKKTDPRDDTSKKKSDDTEYHTGTVSGEGTSKRKTKTSPVYDADWRDVPVQNTPPAQKQLGERYVAGLLEDKRKKK